MRRAFIAVGSIFFLAVPILAFAAADCTNSNTGFVPLACYKGSALQDIYSTGGENALANFFSKLFAFSLSIGAILAVIMIVWGGYYYMFKDSFAAKLNAKEKLTNAVIGLLLLLGTYLILYQINPQILNLSITFPGSGGTAQPTTQSPFQTQAQQQVCAGYTQFQAAQIPVGQFCRDVLGPGWVSIGGDTNCANTTVPNGSTLCAYNPNLNTTQTPQPEGEKELGTFNGTAAIPTGAWCYEYSSNYYVCFNGQTSCSSEAGGNCRQF